MPKNLDLGTNVETTFTDQNGTKRTVVLTVVPEQDSKNLCKNCFFYNENEEDVNHSPCKLDSENYRLLGSCQNVIFVENKN